MSSPAIDLGEAIVLTGPTTTGKSTLAAKLARRVNGALINTDDYYFYASANFYVGLGLRKDEPPKDIPNYLYGGLTPGSTKPWPTTHLHMVLDAAGRAYAQGYTPVFEGCSFLLNRALIQKLHPEKVYALSLDEGDLDTRIAKRIDHLLSDGLVQEVRNLVDRNLHNTWLVQDGIIYRPVFDHCMGDIDVIEMKWRIQEGIKNCALLQAIKYHSMKGIIWLRNNGSSDHIVDNILSLNYSQME